MAIDLRDYQLEAINQLNNGSVLCGGVGSGKSRTAISYYYLKNGGDIKFLTGDSDYVPMNNDVHIKDLYIITTAHKRDTMEWDLELSPFLLSQSSEANIYSNKVIIDSWNNISKYENIKDAFFIFDEQRVVGSGTWVKTFLKVTKENEWILLTATPGDNWNDYIPIFVANGFYKNRTAFIREHIIYARFTKYPKIDRYVNTRRLIRLRDNILINMDYHNHTIPHHETILVDYDIAEYKWLTEKRFNKEKQEPIQSASELCYELRKIVNSDYSRQLKILDILRDHPKIIIFYNFDYELYLLRAILNPLTEANTFELSEWNGHKHQPLPEGNNWAYLVQYTAGAEGWNCITTDTIVCYSQHYSYKVLVQASGRIDRLNTPFTDLYYYHLKSKSSIDIAINRAITQKKKFNEQKFIGV